MTVIYVGVPGDGHGAETSVVHAQLYPTVLISLALSHAKVNSQRARPSAGWPGTQAASQWESSEDPREAPREQGAARRNYMRAA